MDPAGDRDISASDSQVRVLVISAREDLTILRHVMRVLDWTCPGSRPLT
jgi:acetate kinase